MLKNVGDLQEAWHSSTVFTDFLAGEILGKNMLLVSPWQIMK